MHVMTQLINQYLQNVCEMHAEPGVRKCWCNVFITVSYAYMRACVAYLRVFL